MRNCGNSATKNTASFGFATPVSRPARTPARRPAGASARGATPDTGSDAPAADDAERRADSSERSPSVTRTTPPPIFNPSYASRDARISEETPTAESTAHIRTPRLLPAMAARAVRRPNRAEVRMTVAVAGPGVRLTTTATSRKASGECMPEL